LKQEQNKYSSDATNTLTEFGVVDFEGDSGLHSNGGVHRHGGEENYFWSSRHGDMRGYAKFF